MKKRRFRRIATVLFGGSLLLYVVALILNWGDGIPMEARDLNTERHQTVAIFGATGTIGDGLLKAAMSDPGVERIYAITRRPSPRIEEGVASGKVVMTIHKDYQDYSAIRNVLADVDAVFWAIGLSAVGLDEETYREIHIDLPVQLLTQWPDAPAKEDRSFHYVSGSGASADSRMMWARVKAEAEAELEGLARSRELRVVSYRPAFILPTEAEANFGHRVMHALFAPLKSAVAAEAIGQAMIEASARGREYENGRVLENSEIIGLGDAHRDRGQ